MKKRIYSILAIIIIISVILTGCNSGGNNSGQSDNAADSPASVGADASEGGSNSSAGSNTTTDSGAELAATIPASSEIVVDTEFTANDLEVGYEESSAVSVTLNGSSISISGNGASAEGSTLTIYDEGTYVVSGNLEDGRIIVDADDTDKIRIVLNGVTIHCSDNAPVYIKNADKVFLTLKDGTVNTLTDGTEYVQTDDNTVDGVIFSKADLTINGSGTLNITGNYKHGILSKDDLVITGGIYNITAVKDAINGKDCVKIKDGSFTLSSSTGNGIQSKNDEDATRGYVYIFGGTITVTDCQEGIEGTAIVVEGGTIDIIAQDDGLNASSGIASASDTAVDNDISTDIDAVLKTSDTAMADAGFAQAADTQSAAFPIKISDTQTNETTEPNTDSPAEAEDGNAPEGMFPGGSGTAPGTDGTFPDSGTAPGAGGTIPDNGSTDFGNRGGWGNGGGMGAFENNANCYISISGGTINVNAQGDGIDSNGSIYITGGTVTVSGPTNSGNGGLDYAGTADITGGTVIVAGSTGMAQGFSETSTQYSILHNLDAASAAGTTITLTDASGNTLVSYTPAKQYQSIVISTPDLEEGATYTLTCADQTADITLSSVVTSNGQSGMGFPGMGGGRDQGNRPNRGN